jgi:hypothetical protein
MPNCWYTGPAFPLNRQRDMDQFCLIMPCLAHHGFQERPSLYARRNHHLRLLFLKQEGGGTKSNDEAKLSRANFNGVAEFLRWLAVTDSFRRIRHPGALPALIEQFDTWRAAREMSPSAPQSSPVICARCSASGIVGELWETLLEARALIAAGAQYCDCDQEPTTRNLLT